MKRLLMSLVVIPMAGCTVTDSQILDLASASLSLYKLVEALISGITG